MGHPVKPVPEGFHTLTPCLVVKNAASAIEFYTEAFGAEELFRLPAPDGRRILHCELRIGDSNLMLSDEFPEMGCLSPNSKPGSSVTLHLYVQNVDAAFEQAVQAGARVKMPLTDMFWGDRFGKVIDPSGHEWSIATHLRDPSEEELHEAVSSYEI